MLFCRKVVLFFTLSLLAATTVVAQNTYQQPFSASSPWNMTINKSLLNYKNIGLRSVRFSGININHSSWSIPFYYAKNSDSYRKITIYRNPKNTSVKIRMPRGVKGANGSDSHMAIYDPVNKVIHEFYKFDETRNRAAVYKKVKVNGTGISPRKGGNIGTRAYGGSSVGGLLRKAELNSSKPITHPLALAMGSKYLKSGYVWPATSQDGNGKSTYYGWIPMGSLLRIPKNVDVDRLLKNPMARKIAHAMQDYGGYVVDRAGKGPLVMYAEPGTNSSALWAARKDLLKIIPHLYVVKRTKK